MSTRKRSNQKQFSRVPQATVPRSRFGRDFTAKTTFDAGKVAVIYADEVVPGDTISLKMTCYARVSTLVNPIMDNISLDFFYFFIPNRLLWENWERFMGAQDDPGDSVDFLIPQMTSPASVGHVTGSLSDYLTIPIGSPDVPHSSMWHRAYNLTMNEWFRDQNLMDSITVDKDDGPDDPADYANLFTRCKRPDYFTSCLPFLQKGDPVTLPLGSTAPLTIIGVGGAPLYETTADSGLTLGTSTSSDNVKWGGTITTTDTVAWEDPKLGGTADLSSAFSATLNEVRQAYAVQHMLETDARGGTRYVELLKAHFGVTSPDARLNRVEYLGGGTAPIMITPVPTTSAAQSGIIGDLSAYGTASVNNVGFTQSFVEHGVLLGLVASRADINYEWGLNRMFSRRTKNDFFFPAFQHLGEQAVLRKEIYCNGTNATERDDETFGFIPRFDEMRYKPSTITGKMRTAVSGGLGTWHLAEELTDYPELNESFITDATPMARVLAVPTEPHFLFDSFTELQHTRPMPTYSTPGLRRL